MSDYEKARDEAAIDSIASDRLPGDNIIDATAIEGFEHGSDWGRDYVLNSSELRALFGIIELAMTDWLDDQPIYEALSNFKAKFGGGE